MPTWRKAGVNEEFCVREVAVATSNRQWAEFAVPKSGTVRFRLPRPGRWHVSVTAALAAADR